MKKTKAFINIIITTILFSCFSNILLKLEQKKIYNENLLKYVNEIDDYERYLEEYAYYINSLNLTDLEIIVKVMMDTLNQIDGYGKANNLISGYYGLTFLTEGKGVCSSFADDFTRKLNKININYNARNIAVYVDEDKLSNQIQIPITMNFANYNTLKDKPIDYIASSNDEKVTNDDKFIEYLFGNHMITVIEISEHNLKLAVDPTNFIIGYFNDMKFDFFGNFEKNEMRYRDTTIIYSNRTINDELKFLIESFENPSISYESINDIYGYQAQEEAYDYVKELYPFTKKLKK